MLCKSSAKRLAGLLKQSKSSFRAVVPYAALCSSTTPPHSLLTRQDVNRLFTEIGSYREVKEYLLKFSEHAHFAVIKVGGAVLLEALPELVETLGFLQKVGLTPLVVHGAGPQVNETLEKMGVKFDYVQGQRVTTPDVLEVVRKVVFQQNQNFVSALEQSGTRARPLMTGVFTAEKMLEPDLGLVGKIVDVNTGLVKSAAQDGCIPIIACLAATRQGNALNVNADFAAVELAKAVKPLKVVWISGKGGLADEHGSIMDVIDLGSDFKPLMNEPWFKHGDKLKLKLVKDLLAELPRASSVSITAPGSLSRELFTHRGAGTLICNRDRIMTFKDLETVDTAKLTSLLEDAFQGKLEPNYFDTIRGRIAAIHLSTTYNGVAIVLKDEKAGIEILDKFAVRVRNQSEGLGNRLMKLLKDNHNILFWRARKNNISPYWSTGFSFQLINEWYFKHADFSFSVPNSPWNVFGYGDCSFDVYPKMVKQLAEAPPNVLKPEDAMFHTGVNLEVTVNEVPADEKKVRIGLIGARGYTGDEFTQLLDAHDKFDLAIVGSRQFEGKRACDVLTTKSEAMVTNITKEHVADKSKFVDAWVLALPNGLAQDYIQNIPPEIPVVDLSADFRWDPIDIQDPDWTSYWQYGLPERPGTRERLKQAKRVANPGCYASAMQFALLPLTDEQNKSEPFVKIRGVPTCFGISGFSGAGTTPSDKNDPKNLNDNIIPYALSCHGHEKEVSHQFSHSLPQGIYFSPHVASFFRGITMTTTIEFDPTVSIPTEEMLFDLYSNYFQHEPFVEVVPHLPYLTGVVGKHTCQIGGFSVDAVRGRIVVISVLDNLLKGAASVAMQNLNLMFGVEETHTLSPKNGWEPFVESQKCK